MLKEMVPKIPQKLNSDVSIENLDEWLLEQQQML